MEINRSQVNMNPIKFVCRPRGKPARPVGRNLLKRHCHRADPLTKALMPSLLRALALFVLAAATAHAAEPLRVMSFNIRYATESDGANAWSKRTEFFFDTVKAFGPDLVGFQEVLAVQHDAITARLSDYAFAGVARDDGKRKGEWSLIAYRKSRFTAVANGDFWLGNTRDSRQQILGRRPHPYLQLGAPPRDRDRPRVPFRQHPF